MASGKKDESWKNVDDLIERGEYNGALESITAHLDDNSDDFDDTEIRIRSILSARNEYMELADELLQVLLNEPENDVKKLELIAQLESMEKNPSLATRNFLAQAKSAAEFTYYRSLFERLIVQGADETRAGGYSASLSTNAEGFSLYYDDFHAGGYAADLVSSVDGVIDSIRDEIGKYDLLVERLGNTFSQYKSALASQNLNQITASYGDFYSCMSDFADIRNTIARGGWYIRDQFELLKEDNPELTEASYMPFAYRFILGRASTPDSGMLAALDTHWNSLYVPLETEALALLEDSFSDLSNAFSGLAPEDVSAQQVRLETLMAHVDDTIEAVASFNELNALPAADAGEERDTALTAVFPDVEAVQYLRNGFEAQLQVNIRYTEALATGNSLPLPETISRSVSSGNDAAVSGYIAAAAAFASVESDSEANAKSTPLDSALQAKTDGAWAAGENVLEKLCRSTAENASCHKAALWSTLADSLLSGDRTISDNYIAMWDEAEEMLNRPLDPEAKSHPAELIPLMQNALANLEKDYVAIQNTAATLSQSAIDVSNQLFGVSLCLSELDRMRKNVPELISVAEERVTLSKRAESEAVLRTNQARAALRSENFETARDNLQKSRSKYNEALLYQDSDELRLRSDELLIELGNEILRAENEVVVREVRQYKTQAKNSYYQGDFERAENLLVQAQSRWETTNVEDDPEIVSLMSLVNMALSIKTGRTIPVTAPLYPEMSQLLNTANQYYNKAQTLLKQKNNEEALDLLDQARQKLRKVQLVYPLNQEASLLTLRIDQLTDPAAFQEFFARKVDAAKTEYLDVSKRQTVYTDLLDLQEINPKYPGLSDFIYKVELALGIRVLPPDTTSIRESERLTREAQSLFDSGSRNEIVLNSALTKVNQALEKNADNETAQILKDRINTALGGTGTTVLTAEAEALYQRAIQELQKGNTLQASVLVTQLLQDPQNKKSSKILDLKKKVDSLL